MSNVCPQLSTLFIWLFRKCSADRSQISGHDIGAAALQRKKPLDNIHESVCGLHMYCGEPERQVCNLFLIRYLMGREGNRVSLLRPSE